MNLHKEVLKQSFWFGNVKIRISFCSPFIVKSGLKSEQIIHVSIYIYAKRQTHLNFNIKYATLKLMVKLIS